MKRLICILLSVCLVFASAGSALADTLGRCVTVGADNTESGIDTIYSFFRIERGSVPELPVTNGEEKETLAGLVPAGKIGSVALSSVYVEPRTSGGIEVECYNITYITGDMYRAALETAGITDARVIVAAATPVSGTGALTGIYKAYDSIARQRLSQSFEDPAIKPLDENAKNVAVEELVLTGSLQDAIGDVSPEIIQDIKEQLAKTKDMTDDQIRQLIRDTAEKYGAVLDDEWVEKILDLIKKMNDLGIDPDTFLRLAEAKQEADGFFAAVGNFFRGIGDFFIGLFSGFGNGSAGPSPMPSMKYASSPSSGTGS